MKKWLLGLLISFLLFLGLVYIFIPGILTVTTIKAIDCTINGTNRYLLNPGKWKMWWPSGSNTSILSKNTDSFFINKKCTYQVTKKFYNSIEVSIKYGEDTSITSSVINFIPIAHDSVVLEWKCSIASGLNPFTRIEQYNKATAIKNNMDEILGSIKSFLEKNENIYGIKIKRITTTDTLLIATKSILPSYPSTSDIYSLINNLRNYIRSENASETGTPIMNVEKIDSIQYKLMVAVPTNKILQGDAKFFFVRMIPGSFMSTEVEGGNYTIQHAFNQLQMYMTDYQKTPMAIPFNALITDRTMEPDTSKWITRLYQPVF
ncbi:MAG: hypothetical protein ACRDE8_06190 [Ginsengibacter sp.]